MKNRIPELENIYGPLGEAQKFALDELRARGRGINRLNSRALWAEINNYLASPDYRPSTRKRRDNTGQRVSEIG